MATVVKDLEIPRGRRQRRWWFATRNAQGAGEGYGAGWQSFGWLARRHRSHPSLSSRCGLTGVADGGARGTEAEPDVARELQAARSDDLFCPALLLFVP